MAVAVETKYDRLMQWREGKTPGPWRISLYPTYRCNIQCKICWKREFPEPLTVKEELPTDRILHLVDEAAEMGVREWIIGGGGELMLRGKAVMAMVRKIRQHGMNGLIQTNATRFTEENLRELVDLEWECLNVSLDGPTAEINDSNRTENNFDRAIETIQRLQALKKQKGTIYPLIHLTTVVTNINYRHLKGMVDLSKRLDLSPGSLRAVDLIIYGEHDKRFLLTPEQRAELPGVVEEAIAYAVAQGVTCHYGTYLGAVQQDNRMPKAIDLFSASESMLSGDTMCFEPFLHQVIMAEGNAGPCCTFNDKDCSNIWNASLKEVWMGPYMQQVRQQILSGDAPHFCKECMITQVQLNRDTQREFKEFLLTEPMTLPKLANKAAHSIKKHGLAKSFKRGQEWLQIRARGRNSVSS